MALTSNLTLTGTLGGNNVNASISRTHAGAIPQSVSVPAAKAGTLSTRTNNTDGTLTLGSGHGITTGATIDLYWTNGARRNVTVGTVSGTSVPISSGTGDNLPTQDTAITATTQTTVDVDFVGDLLKVLSLSCDKRFTVQVMESTTARLALVLPANEPYLWFADGGVTNPLATYTISSMKVSQSDSAAAATFIAGIGYASG